MNTITIEQLHRIAGYIEAGEGETVTYCQDDATKSWCVKVGNMSFYDASLGVAFKMALSNANAYHAKTYDMGPA